MPAPGVELIPLVPIPEEAIAKERPTLLDEAIAWSLGVHEDLLRTEQIDPNPELGGYLVPIEYQQEIINRIGASIRRSSPYHRANQAPVRRPGPAYVTWTEVTSGTTTVTPTTYAGSSTNVYYDYDYGNTAVPFRTTTQYQGPIRGANNQAPLTGEQVARADLPPFVERYAPPFTDIRPVFEHHVDHIVARTDGVMDRLGNNWNFPLQRIHYEGQIRLSLDAENNDQIHDLLLAYQRQETRPGRCGTARLQFRVVNSERVHDGILFHVEVQSVEMG